MNIKSEDWVRLKSDHNKEYNVRGKSTFDGILDCLTFGGERKMLKEENVELITDVSRLEYLESHKDKLFQS